MKEMIVYGLAMFILNTADDAYTGKWFIAAYFENSELCCEAKEALDKRILLQPVSYECFVSVRGTSKQERVPDIVNCKEI